MTAQRWIHILWPAFIVGGIGEGIFFTVVDPHDLTLFGSPLDSHPVVDLLRWLLLLLGIRGLFERSDPFLPAHGGGDQPLPHP